MKMSGIKELIRIEEDGTLSFGAYELAEKAKKSDYEYEGDLYKVKTFDEITKLEKNDILVTKFTDTGWTTKFAKLSGIVTEYGGILCHTAIVSREYGIPCIVCAYDAMKKIKDGDLITINGTTGEIVIENKK